MIGGAIPKMLRGKHQHCALPLITVFPEHKRIDARMTETVCGDIELQPLIEIGPPQGIAEAVVFRLVKQATHDRKGIERMEKGERILVTKVPIRTVLFLIGSCAIRWVGSWTWGLFRRSAANLQQEAEREEGEEQAAEA